MVNHEFGISQIMKKERTCHHAMAGVFFFMLADSPLRAGLPIALLVPGDVVELFGEGEEVVAQAVDVAQERGIDLGLLGHTIDGTLGTAADGAADVGQRGSTRAAGQDEATPARKPFLGSIDGVLECGYVNVFDITSRAHFALAGVGGQDGADGEEEALHVGEQGKSLCPLRSPLQIPLRGGEGPL